VVALKADIDASLAGANFKYSANRKSPVAIKDYEPISSFPFNPSPGASALIRRSIAAPRFDGSYRKILPLDAGIF
jgi:hypothetical protein